MILLRIDYRAPLNLQAYCHQGARAKTLVWQVLVAESAGVEPARPEGLAALAPRCLAARPTLRLSKWSPRRDSNAQPEASDASALVH